MLEFFDRHPGVLYAAIGIFDVMVLSFIIFLIIKVFKFIF